MKQNRNINEKNENINIPFSLVLSNILSFYKMGNQNLIVMYKFIRNLNFYMVLISFRMVYMSLRLNLEYYSYIFRAKELLTCMKIRNLFVFM